MTTPRIWLIDDSEHWHHVTQGTLVAWGKHQFKGFYQSSSLFMALMDVPPPNNRRLS